MSPFRQIRSRCHQRASRSGSGFVWTMAVALLLAACGGDGEEVGKIVIKGGGNGPSGNLDASDGGTGDSEVSAADGGTSLPKDTGGGAVDIAGTADVAVVDTSVGTVDIGTVNEDGGNQDDGGAVGDAAPDTGPPGGCKLDADCSPWGLVCDLDAPGGTCVPCNYGTDCKGLFAICVLNKCVNQPPCADEAPCKAMGEVCDSMSGHCVKCLVDKDCGNDWSCKAKTCIPPPTGCQSSKGCAALGQVCDKTAGACVDCLDDADCVAKEHCSEGVCVGDVCKPGLVQCATGDSLQTCKPSGAGWTVALCPKGNACHQGVCAPVICTGGQSKCVDAGVATCVATGTAWTPAKPCAKDNICIDGACKPAICKPGATKCESGGLATCSADGTAWTVTACEAGKSCVIIQDLPLCMAQLCKPKMPYCEADKAHLCAADGMSSKAFDDCAAKGLKCVAGACAAESCKVGESTCKGDQLAVCDGTGKAWILQPCTKGLVCKEGVCGKPGPCTSTLKAEAKAAKADVIIAVDTTSSMKKEFGPVNGALGALGQALKDGGVDHRVVVIAKDTGCCKICVPPPLGQGGCKDGGNLKRVVAWVEGKSQLKVMIDTWDKYKSFLRPDATRHLLTISDDKSDYDAGWFKSAISKLSAPGFPKGFVMHSITSVNCPDDDTNDAVVSLAKETGGHAFPICKGDGNTWNGWMKTIASDIGKGGMACTYPISAAMKTVPDLAKSLKVTATIGGAKTSLSPLAAGKTCGPALEYELLGKPPVAITVCPSACALIKGGELSTEYACP